MIKLLVPGFLALATGLGFSMNISAQAATPLDAKAAAQFQREMRRHVGEVFPAGLMARNRLGQEVDVRDAFGSRTILLKLDKNCEPCMEIIDFLQKNPPEADTSVIVMMVDDAGEAAPDLPPEVTYLHTAEDLRSGGCLAGEYTPTTFYFDENLRLLKREVGAPFPISNLLQFPKQ